MTLARKIRNKNHWKIVKEKINNRDNFMCRICLAEGVFTYQEIETHHIIPIEEDPNKAYDEDNAITLCRPHHEEAESGRISREYLSHLAATPTTETVGKSPRG